MRILTGETRGYFYFCSVHYFKSILLHYYLNPQLKYTALIYALKKGNIDICELLLNMGADVDIRDDVCDGYIYNKKCHIMFDIQ